MTLSYKSDVVQETVGLAIGICCWWPFEPLQKIHAFLQNAECLSLPDIMLFIFLDMKIIFGQYDVFKFESMPGFGWDCFTKMYKKIADLLFNKFKMSRMNKK